MDEPKLPTGFYETKQITFGKAKASVTVNDHGDPIIRLDIESLDLIISYNGQNKLLHNVQLTCHSLPKSFKLKPLKKKR